MAKDPVAQANQLLGQGHVADAIALIERSADAGDAGALFQKAVWKLSGTPLRRDLPGARAALRRATALGHVDAALIEVALLANGSGGPADWAGALSLLKATAKASEAAASQLALLRQMKLTADGAPVDPPTPRQISEQPNVWHVARLFTTDECLHIAQSAADLLQPAVVVDPKTGRNVVDPVRTSDGAVIGPTRETLVVRALNRRLAALTGTDVRQGEALAVLRYNAGQQFRPHFDSLEGTSNQRVKTVLIYLNEGFLGGATSFTRKGLRVTPHAGDAIIFDNVRRDGSIDPTAQHAGEPVTRGTKWLATRWIRARPFDVWTGPEV